MRPLAERLLRAVVAAGVAMAGPGALAFGAALAGAHPWSGSRVTLLLAPAGRLFAVVTSARDDERESALSRLLAAGGRVADRAELERNTVALLVPRGRGETPADLP